MKYLPLLRNITLGNLLLAATFGLVALMPCAIAQTTSDETSLHFGGMGGIYLLAEPRAELWIEIEKIDLNRTGGKTHLRAILFSPDRRVIDEKWLADDGQDKGSGPGPVQRLRFSTQVPRKGVYGVNITVTTDRYGDNVAWGFKTNCARYLVETSRGHRDADHEEPLVLLSPDRSGDVCFQPGQGEFSIEATEVPEGMAAIAVFSPDGQEAGTLPVANGEANGTFDAGSAVSDRPWRMHLPQFAGRFHIDGVTRWTRDETFPDMSLWTPDENSWFPFHQYRWLLTPYSRIVYEQSNPEKTYTFQIHNNDAVAHDVALELEPAEGLAWDVELSHERVSVGAKESVPVALRYTLPDMGENWTCYVRATPLDHPGMTTYSTLELRRGAAPAANPIEMPLELEPYRHENAQFGYLPTYPLTNQVYFDLRNRPFVAGKNEVHLLRDGAWTTVDKAVDGKGEERAFTVSLSKVAFDDSNDAYLIGSMDGKPVLLHLPEDADVVDAAPIPGGGNFDIEQFSGHNTEADPPPFIRFTLTARDPKLIWRRVNDLHLFLPEKNADGRIEVGEPVLLSRKCIGSSSHSGIPSNVVSRDGKVHVAWGEATEPDEGAPGVPTYVGTYDRATGELSEPALVGYGPPANDIHNTPCITMDSEGYLHVLVGTHGQTFRYARSFEPNTAADGWTEPVETAPGLRQTYVGLVCDTSDTLHLVFRLWRENGPYFPASHYATLAYMSKPKDGAWSEPKVLVVSPFSEYSIFYHRLTINRAGALFLSYDYWSTFWFYRNDHPGSRRALMTSPDQGRTWKLADKVDLRR